MSEGFDVADERGDNIPRDEMSKLLVQLGEPAPVSKARQVRVAAPNQKARLSLQSGPGCSAGPHAHPLLKPPIGDALGQKIFESVCATCWEYWLRDLSIKVINEMRLDLSTERGQEVYDQIMRETLGLDQ